MTTVTFRESSIRSLRDRIYGPCGDVNWNNCREHWMTPQSVRWLAEQVHMELKKEQAPPRSVDELIACCVERHEFVEP